MRNHKTGLLITARLKSSRLAKKLLLRLGSKSVIEHVITRALKILPKEKIVLCTSQVSQDDPLEEISLKLGINCYRGEPEDVLKRNLNAAQEVGFENFLSVTGDNPLFSIEYAKILIDEINSTDDDYLYFERIPMGLNSYALRTKAVDLACKIKPIIDTEIWGPLFDYKKIFSSRGIYINKNFMAKRYTLDVKEDYEFLSQIFDHFQSNKLILISDHEDFLISNKDILKLNSHIKQRKLKKEIKSQILNHYKTNYEMIKELKAKIY